MSDREAREDLVAQQIGKRLCHVRKKFLNLTQEKLASELTVRRRSGGEKPTSPQMVSVWERGVKRISPEYERLITNYLNEWEGENVFNRRELLGSTLAAFVFHESPRVFKEPAPEEAEAKETDTLEMADRYMGFANLLLGQLCNLPFQEVEEVSQLRRDEYMRLQKASHTALRGMYELLPRLVLDLPDSRAQAGELRDALRLLVLSTYPKSGVSLPRYAPAAMPEAQNLHDIWHEANKRFGEAYVSLRRSLGRS